MQTEFSDRREEAQASEPADLGSDGIVGVVDEKFSVSVAEIAG
jgi:hypothetical protein